MDRREMIVETDVKCLYCGRVSWRVQCEHGACSQTSVQVWPQQLGPLPARPRCTYCGGPVYWDDDFRRLRLTAAEWRAGLPRARAVQGQSVGGAPPKRRPALAPAAACVLERVA